MKVLYFADTRFPIERANGVQTMATCRALALRGHDVTLVVRPDTASEPRDPYAFYGFPRPASMSIITIPTVRDVRLRRMRFLVQAGIMASRHSGVVYTRDLGLASFLLQAPLARRARVVYESHGIADIVSAELPRLLGRPDAAPSAAKLRRLARREARVWQRASAYVTITRALAEDLSARFGPRPNVHVVPDGGTSSARTDPARPWPVPPVVGYAGHLYPWKGVDVLIRALALVPEVRALVIGGHPAEADLSRIEALVASLQLTSRVHLAGQVPPAEVAARLEEASILVLPNTASTISDRYTSPLKLFEYLGMGRPIVASDLAAIREVLVDDQSALLASPGDPVALARAIQRLTDDPGLARRLAAGALALAPQFTWEARAARLEPALAVAAG